MAFARLLFPAEAKVAMDLAHAETTLEFAGLSASRGSSGNLREVDLNETPVVRNKKLRSRMEALQKTGSVRLSFCRKWTVQLRQLCATELYSVISETCQPSRWQHFVGKDRYNFLFHLLPSCGSKFYKQTQVLLVSIQCSCLIVEKSG